MDKLKSKLNKKCFLIVFFAIVFISVFILSLIILNNPNQFSDTNQIKSNVSEVTPALDQAQTGKEVTQGQTGSQNQTFKTAAEKNVIEVSESSLKVAGWIPTWASAAGLQSLQNNPNYFSTVSPVWYEVRSDGSLNPKYPANKAAIVNHTRNNNLELIPTIGMFDHNLFGEILRSEQNRARHIDSIVNTVNTNNYHGIDLDYESISFADKELYFEFLNELSTRLKANGKTLTVTVLAKWGDNVRYSYRPETRQVQDWSRISLYADEIRIMAYDYTYSGDMYPGPIGPTGWIRRILEYSEGQIPAEKTVLGIHLYAYEWYQPAGTDQTGNGAGQSNGTGQKLNIQIDSSLNSQQNPHPARAYTYSTVANILRDYQGEHSSFEDEGIFFYTAVNKTTGIQENRALIYIDPDGVKARTDLAREYGLKGVVFWRLGSEGQFKN